MVKFWLMLWAPGSSKNDLWDHSRKVRSQGYVEVLVVSTIFFAYDGLVIYVVQLIWNALTDDRLRWEVGVVAGLIGILPYLVVAAKIWNVNLSLFGQRAVGESERSASEASDRPESDDVVE